MSTEKGPFPITMWQAAGFDGMALQSGIASI
jgi:hypothetical protein